MNQEEIEKEAKVRELERIQRELTLRGAASGDFSDLPISPLPLAPAERKAIPLWEGVMAYAPAALIAAAKVSVMGNLRHNPGEELHHARGKSMDHTDCIARHLVDYQALQTAIRREGPRVATTAELDAMHEHLGNLVWRVLMFAQEQIEQLGRAPLAPRARLPQPPPETK